MDMVCIYCGSKTAVSNSRLQVKTNSVWRRRTCLACKAVITSVERVDLRTSFSYKPRNSALEPFKREVLLISVYEACKHLKHPETTAMELTDTIVSKVCNQMNGAVIDRAQLTTVATEVIQRFNPAAATSYQAFHP